MATIAALVGNYFEDVEYTEPVKAFKEAGHIVINVGLKAGESVHGKKGKAAVTIDKAVTDVSPSDFDALFIPGGYSPDQLRAHDTAVGFVRQFSHSSKPMLVICHGPQLLITADVIKGRKITGWKSIVQDIKNAGGKYVDEEVVEDNNLISSRGPADIPAFVRESLSILGEVYAVR